MASSCITLFIASPWPKQYKGFAKQEKAAQWYFPVWTLDKLQICQRYCFSNLSMETLKERHRMHSGVARSVFHKVYSTIAPDIMEEALADQNMSGNHCGNVILLK
jgi:hypothetical protein